MSPKSAPESFTAFKKSFHYGERSDISFKWLERLPDEEAAEFFSELLALVGDMLDSGDAEPIIRKVYQWNVRGYNAEFDHVPFTWSHDSAPFTPLTKPVSESKIALFSSSGHFVAGHDPDPFGFKDMSDEEAAGRTAEFALLESSFRGLSRVRDIGTRSKARMPGGHGLNSVSRKLLNPMGRLSGS